MIEFTVEPDNGDPFDVTATARDVLLWEKTHHGKTFSRLIDNLNMVDFYALAHLAARRQGLFGGSLDEFEKTCELHFEEGETDPTQPDHSPDE